MSVSKSLAGILFVVAIIIGIVIGYAIGYFTAAPGPVAPAPAPEVGLRGEVPIGALLPLTGGLASYGENDKAALEFAEKEINEWLKSMGKGWYIKLYVEDSATDPKTAYDKLMALHARGIKFVIGPMASIEVSEVKSYADANEILIISQSSTSPALAIPGDWVFRYVPCDLVQGPAAAKVAYDQGIRYMVQVWRGDTYGDGLAKATKDAFLKLLKEKGEVGDVIEGVRYPPDAREFSAEAAKVASVVEDLVSKYGKEKVGVYLVGFEEATAFMAVAKGYPILSEVKWVGSDGTAGIAPLVKERDLAEMAVKTEFLNPIAKPVETPHTIRVRNAVIEKLGRAPEPYAYGAYDALWTIAIALNLVDKYDSKAVKAILPEVVKRYYGALGNFELNDAGDIGVADYELWVVWPTDTGYEWRIAGVWRYLTNSIEWTSWWLEAKART